MRPVPGNPGPDVRGPWPRPADYVRPYLSRRPYRLSRKVPDFLSRFRPAGAPGAALAGVPADRRRELEAEVGPVLALLAGTQAECERIIARARQDAGQLAAEAAAEAAAISADAGRRAAAAREDAARRVMAAARDGAATAIREAEHQAGATRELAARRMPAMADRAVDAIRRLEADER